MVEEKCDSYLEAIEKIGKKADKLISNPHPIDEDFIEFNQFVQRVIPDIGFEESFQREKAANTPVYQEIEREAHELIYGS